jgi:hypothetical protein
MIVVSSEIHLKHVNTFCGNKMISFLMLKQKVHAVNHCALNS